ncbi:MAG TPA: sodium:proton antiporter [Terriglobia bacterium]|nr:sodium:proton antiporter [Terriglobia bacterium]
MDTEYILTESIGLLMAASVVAIIARRLRLPYTVGLVLAGIAMAFAHFGGNVRLTHDLIFDLLLPPLLFEAALAIEWRELKRDALPVLVLSIFGVVVSAAVVTYGMTALLHWPLAPALLFGVLISATDPVAVIAMFKDTGIGGRLRLVVESESLFNDGVAAVFFVLALGFAQAGRAADSGAALSAGVFGLALAHTALGGIAIGLACGGVAILVMGRSRDHLIETSVTTVTAYGAFLAAEHFGASGVLATVSAGLLIGNLGRFTGPHGSLAEGPDNGGATGAARGSAYGSKKRHRFSLQNLRVPELNMTDRGRDFIIAFWEFAAFLANSLIFLLIGLTIAGTAFDALGWTALVIVNLLVLAARLASVYPLCLLFRGSRWRVPMREQHVLWWGGLRGALALALVLALPPDFPLRDEIVVAAFATVSFSVLIQGLTMPMLLRVLGISRETAG